MRKKIMVLTLLVCTLLSACAPAGRVADGAS